MKTIFVFGSQFQIEITDCIPSKRVMSMIWEIFFCPDTF